MLHEFLKRGGRAWSMAAAGLCLVVPLVVTADEPPTEAELIEAGREGAALAEELRATAPQATYDPEQGAITIERVDRIQLEHLTGVPEARAAQERSRLQALNGADAEQLNEAGQQALRASETDPSMTGDVHRLLRSQQEEDYATVDADEALEASRQILSAATYGTGAGTAASALGKAALEDFSDCAAEVEIENGPGREAGAISNEVCEMLRERPDVTRVREIKITTVPVSAAPYRNTLVARETTAILAAGIPTNALSYELSFEWEGTVAGVEQVEEATRENGFRGRFRVIYDEAACAGIPATDPCAGRLQSVVIRYIGSYRTLREELVCSEENCLLDTDGFATAQWTCTDSEPREIEGVVIDSSYPGLQPLFPGSEGLCWSAKAKYDHHYAEGEICWDTLGGGQRCEEQLQPPRGTTTCPRIAALTASGETTCTQARVDCAEDGSGHNGFCYVEYVGFRCTTRERYRDLQVRTRNTCATSMRCMGTECLPAAERQLNEASDVDVSSYGRQSAYNLLVHHILNDWTPTGEDTPPARLFEGNPYECRKALGGATDCCVAEIPGAQALWFDIYSKAQRKEQARVALSNTPNSAGAAAALSWGSPHAGLLNRPFLSDRETILGGTGRLGTAPAGGMTIPEIMPEFLRQAREQLGVSGGWHCSEREFDLAALRSVGACSLVGTRCSGIGCLDKRDVYCCMNSPVSKNAREIMRATNFGSAKNPTCEGVLLEEVRRTNWSGASLDDLVARLQRAGVLPQAENLLQQTSQDAVTGSGSTLAEAFGERQAVGRRAAEALDSFDDRAVTTTMEAQLRSTVPGEVADPQHAGVLEWSPGFVTVRGGEPGTLMVRRLGKRGTVSVQWETRSLTAQEGIDFERQSGTLTWAAGETDAKPIGVSAFPNARLGSAEAPMEFQVLLSNPTNGAILGAHSTAIVRIGRFDSGPISLVPGVRVTKRGDGGAAVSPDMGSQPVLFWEIVLENRSFLSADITVSDVLPSVMLTRWENCPGQASDGLTDRPTCSVRLENSETLVLRLRTTGLGSQQGGRQVRNRCTVSGTWYDGAGDVWGPLSAGRIFDECQADATFPMPSDGGPTPPQGCPMDPLIAPVGWSNSGLTWRQVSSNGTFPPGPALVPVTMEARGYLSIPFVAPASGSMRLRYIPHVRTTAPSYEGATVTISECSADFRDPVAPVPPSEPTLARACRHFISSEGSVQLFTVNGEAGTCALVPGRQYFFNVIYAGGASAIRGGYSDCPHETCTVDLGF